jgi:hypothetical protein
MSDIDRDIEKLPATVFHTCWTTTESSRIETCAALAVFVFARGQPSPENWSMAEA